ncbi:hypothetical protein JKP88DRAFT_308950 [Tribonema minus]|uniref:Uncharacterized protein n=1 Tax=Tribonema minus TaxID=303371 RepID=A0A835Z4A3_9STRA|nr:hypothetical protein JKP88DRAFT_308950 [Tribonema minus]
MMDQRLKDKLEDVRMRQEQQQRQTEGTGAGATPVNAVGPLERMQLDDSAQLPVTLNAGHPLVDCLANSKAKRMRQLLRTTTSADVLDNTKLCSAVLEFVGRGHWLYIAAVSRGVRATYMAMLAQSGWDARWLCRTTVYAASQSLAAFEYAIAHGLNEPVLRTYGKDLQYKPLLDIDSVQASIGATCSHDIMAAAADAADKHHEGDADFMCGDDGSALTWFLQLLSQENVPSFLLPFLCSVAVEAGHLHTLQVLLSSAPKLREGRTAPPDNEARPGILAGYDKTDLVAPTRYDADEHPLELLDTAIANGHAHIIDWLRGSDCVPPHTYTDYSAVAAAYGGNLPLLQWLHAQPQHCPWDDEAVVEATLLSPDASPEQLAWLRSTGALDWSSAAVRTCHLVDAVALGFTGKPDMAEWLLPEGAQ